VFVMLTWNPTDSEPGQGAVRIRILDDERRRELEVPADEADRVVNDASGCRGEGRHEVRADVEQDRGDDDDDERCNRRREAPAAASAASSSRT
jgi:hypothetical protein